MNKNYTQKIPKSLVLALGIISSICSSRAIIFSDGATTESAIKLAQELKANFSVGSGFIPGKNVYTASTPQTVHFVGKQHVLALLKEDQSIYAVRCDFPNKSVVAHVAREVFSRKITKARKLVVYKLRAPIEDVVPFKLINRNANIKELLNTEELHALTKGDTFYLTNYITFNNANYDVKAARIMYPILCTECSPFGNVIRVPLEPEKTGGNHFALSQQDTGCALVMSIQEKPTLLGIGWQSKDFDLVRGTSTFLALHNGKRASKLRHVVRACLRNEAAEAAAKNASIPTNDQQISTKEKTIRSSKPFGSKSESYLARRGLRRRAEQNNIKVQNNEEEEELLPLDFLRQQPEHSKEEDNLLRELFSKEAPQPIINNEEDNPFGELFGGEMSQASLNHEEDDRLWEIFLKEASQPSIEKKKDLRPEILSKEIPQPSTVVAPIHNLQNLLPRDAKNIDPIGSNMSTQLDSKAFYEQQARLKKLWQRAATMSPNRLTPNTQGKTITTVTSGMQTPVGPRKRKASEPIKETRETKNKRPKQLEKIGNSSDEENSGTPETAYEGEESTAEFLNSCYERNKTGLIWQVSIADEEEGELVICEDEEEN